jgi:HlyD family secretion protein
VTSVGADVGDRVAAGQMLASIDPADYERQVEADRARLDGADAAAARATNGSRPQERAQAGDAVASARAAVARTQAAVDLARLNDARERQLLATGDVPAQQADAARTALLDATGALNAARAQLAAAEQSASLVVEGPRAEDRAAAFADAAAARANLGLAETTLRKTTLVAPADAYVLSRDLEPGNIAQPGAVAFILTDAGTPDILVNVPESLVAGLRPGTPALVRTGRRSAFGAVTRVEPAADAASRTAQVRVRAPQLDLRPGDVVDVALQPERASGASVPTGALLDERDGTYVSVYDATHATVRRVRVRTLIAGDERVTLTGIAPGTPVVTMGQHLALPGDAVRVVSGV